MIYISFDKLIEILSPLILIVCIIALIGLNKDYDAEREQEKRQALEAYRVTVNSETQEIKSYWIVYDDLIPDGDITKKVVHDYSDFIKGRFDENASWSKTSGEKKYNASGILTYIASRTEGKVEMYHSNFHKNGADFDCLISSQPDSVAISLYYEF